MKYREKRELLVESMETVIELPDFEALEAHLRERHRGTAYETGALTVEPYGDTPERRLDKRIGWDTHIVCINGNAIGYTDGPAQRRVRRVVSVEDIRKRAEAVGYDRYGLDHEISPASVEQLVNDRGVLLEEIRFLECLAENEYGKDFRKFFGWRDGCVVRLDPDSSNS